MTADSKWVGTTHKTLYTGLQIVMFVYENVCVFEFGVWTAVYTGACLCTETNAPEQNSQRHPSIQQRMMDMGGSATNYPFYTDEGGWPSSP